MKIPRTKLFIFLVLIALFLPRPALAQEMPVYGDWVCEIWVRTTSWLPATPSQYWLGNIVYSAAENIPFIGAGIIYEVFNQLKLVLGLVVAWKLFKSLPGRF